MRTRVSPRTIDVLLVAVIAIADLSLLWLVPASELGLPGYEGPSLLGSAVLVAANLPLLWRRRFPTGVLVATTALAVAVGLLPLPSQLIGPLAALYTVAACTSRRRSLTAAAVVGALTTILVLLGGAETPLLVLLVIIATAWLLGDGQRARQDYASDLAERARALVSDRERAAELAIVEERTRIARELHDVVAHSLGVMVVQAGAARRVLPDDPERARAAARQVTETGRQTLAELREVLGVLRQDGDGVAYEPQPSLDALGELLARYAGSPLRIALRVEGDPQPLPPGLDLSAYRIIQESITNALRHAAPARVEVRLLWQREQLVIEVSDDGPGSPVPVGADSGGPPLTLLESLSRGGHGLRGMAERAALVGGTFDAGPRPGGGFAVTATLPLEVS